MIKNSNQRAEKKILIDFFITAHVCSWGPDQCWMKLLRSFISSRVLRAPSEARKGSPGKSATATSKQTRQLYEFSSNVGDSRRAAILNPRIRSRPSGELIHTHKPRAKKRKKRGVVSEPELKGCLYPSPPPPHYAASWYSAIKVIVQNRNNSLFSFPVITKNMQLSCTTYAQV